MGPYRALYQDPSIHAPREIGFDPPYPQVRELIDRSSQSKDGDASRCVARRLERAQLHAELILTGR